MNDRQRKYLAGNLNPSRVGSRSQGGRTFSYLEAWDVRRTLIRVFGYGGFSAEVLSCDLAFEEETTTGSSNRSAWHVGYRVTMRLTIPVATYTEVAIGAATLPDRGQAHDMAVKTAESDALKRCAINLGTQFGLSLYQNGSMVDVVKWTLDTEAPETAETAQDEPVAPEVAPEPETPAAAPESTPDTVPNVGTDVDLTLADLRAVYRLDTAAAKVKRVAEIKSTLDADTLAAVVTIQGSDMTIERLIDKVTSDAIAGVMG